MTRIRKFIRADITALGDDEVEVIMSTDILARDGHVLVPQGCRLNNYAANPIVLWGHDPDQPIGNAPEVEIDGDKIRALVRFAPLGISPRADEVRGLVKSGVVRTVSVGFDPIDGAPLDPKKPKGGQRFTDWELLELSFCSVPVDTGAVVTARQLGDETTMPEPTASAAQAAPQNRAISTTTRNHKVAFVRGVYDIGRLCSLFESLGWQVDSAKWEAAIEGDNSPLPGMLAGILHDLGDAIIAMTIEEISEALAGYDVEVELDNDMGMDDETRAHIRAATSPAVRAFRYGMTAPKTRAGKSFSAENVRCLREAKAMHEEAISTNRSAIAQHKRALAAVDDMLDRAGVSDPDGNDDTTTVQTSAGMTDTSDPEGERAAADFQKRQADLAALMTR